ncbi:MAG: EF-hand domain-containing protein [Phycisphaerales bacterium]|nr:EF-hand domain-containing protein [Phycisphaerales bacterium]
MNRASLAVLSITAAALAAEAAHAQCSSYYMVADTGVGTGPRKFRQSFSPGNSARSYSSSNNGNRRGWAAIWYGGCNKNWIFESPWAWACTKTKGWPSSASVNLCKVCWATNNPGDAWRSCSNPWGPGEPDQDDRDGPFTRSEPDIQSTFIADLGADPDNPVLSIDPASEIRVFLDGPSAIAPTGHLQLLIIDPMTGEEIDAGTVTLRVGFEPGTPHAVPSLEATGLCATVELVVDQAVPGQWAVNLEPLEMLFNDPGQPRMFGGVELVNTDNGVWPCAADFDRSGFVDLEDFVTFVAAFEAGTDDADFDESGFVDLEDFSSFVAAFEEGC